MGERLKIGVVGPVVRPVRNCFFEHPMATYAAALAHRGLFGLSPFLLVLVILVGAIGLPDFFDRAVDHASAQEHRQVPRQLELGMRDRAEEQAGGKLLFFGVGIALWSVSAVARTLTEAFNVAYQVAETCRWWKQLLLSWPSVPSSRSW